MEDNGVAAWQSQTSRMSSTARSTTEALFRVPVAGATESPYAEDAIPPQTDAVSQKFKTHQVRPRGQAPVPRFLRGSNILYLPYDDDDGLNTEEMMMMMW